MTPESDAADDNWKREERLDRDIEREPADPLEPVQTFEDGYEKSLMVGFEPDEDDGRRVHDEPSLSHLGMYGEG